MENYVPKSLDGLRDTINRVFDVLEVLLVRILLLTLAGMEAYALIVGHH
jgi:hypothetical protein